MIWVDIFGENNDRDVGVVNTDMCELWHCLYGVEEAGGQEAVKQAVTGAAARHANIGQLQIQASWRTCKYEHTQSLKKKEIT